MAGLEAPYPYETNPATAAANIHSNDDFSYVGTCSCTRMDPPGLEPGTLLSLFYVTSRCSTILSYRPLSAGFNNKSGNYCILVRSDCRIMYLYTFYFRKSSGIDEIHPAFVCLNPVSPAVAPHPSEAASPLFQPSCPGAAGCLLSRNNLPEDLMP